MHTERISLGLLLHRGSLGRLIPLCAGLSLLLAASAARAQGFDVQHFKPTPSQQDGYFTLHAARPLEFGEFEIGAVVDYARNPLVLIDSSGKRVDSIVRHMLVGDALLAVGVLPRVELGVDAPLVLVQRGDQPTSKTLPDASGGGVGIGDVALALKIGLVVPEGAPYPSGVGLALVGVAYVPTGDPALFRGEPFRIEPRLVFDYTARGGARFGIQAGYLVRPKAALLNAEVNDEITAGIGAGTPLDEKRKFHVFAEATSRTDVLASHFTRVELPIEFALGARYIHPAGVMFEAGFGTGLHVGVGAPDYRIIAGISYRLRHDPDPDHDKIYAPADQCPDDPEDKDGFQDEDGCPDPDNDKDGVTDLNDKCPNRPEDKDGFEDSDGCPDPDNDKDGILDVDDKCPNQPEDKDGFEDDDGCPDTDNDKDGIPDIRDKCPDQAEDKDGFEDVDGCPDPDNDQDGIPDVNDKCPDQPEDFDGFEDSDGCPEPGTGLVKLTCDKIEIHDKVYFDTNKDRIQARSFPLLDQVAAVINAAAQVKRVRIEGHTDNRGGAKHNLDLSERRAGAVLQYLAARGVDESRLESHGYGAEQPIASNKTTAGRAENRRVQFMILESDLKCTK